MNDERDPGDEHTEPHGGWRIPTSVAEIEALGLPVPSALWNFDSASARVGDICLVVSGDPRYAITTSIEFSRRRSVVQ